MANILLIARGSGGDLFPFTHIGSTLKARGHDVTLFTHCYYENLVKRAGLDFVALDRPDEFKLMIEDQTLLRHPRGLKLFYLRHILPQVITEYGMIQQRCRSGDTILVSHHNAHLASQISAEKLGIPLVLVFLAPSFITNMPILGSLFDLLAGDVNQIRAKVGLPAIHDWNAWLRPGQGIALWPEWFAAPESDWPPGLVPIGFVMHGDSETVDIPIEIQEILDDGVPPILVTGGTGTWVKESEFYAVGAEACRALGQPGILVTRRKELVPSRLPSRVKWAEYLPFASLMPRMGAIIHHGGIGTSAQALAAGVPQLVLAAGLDRRDNALRLKRLGVAEFLLPSQWQPEVAAGALRRASSDITRMRCKELAHRLSEADPVTDVCQMIEKSMSIERHA